MTTAESPTLRTRTEQGHQIVEVSGRFAYSWTGSRRLRVGDLVVVPASEWVPAHVAKVTQLGSEWSGYLRPIIAKAAKA